MVYKPTFTFVGDPHLVVPLSLRSQDIAFCFFAHAQWNISYVPGHSTTVRWLSLQVLWLRFAPMAVMAPITITIFWSKFVIGVMISFLTVKGPNGGLLINHIHKLRKRRPFGSWHPRSELETTKQAEKLRPETEEIKRLRDLALLKEFFWHFPIGHLWFGTSIYRGFQKWGYPQIIHFDGNFPIN